MLLYPVRTWNSAMRFWQSQLRQASVQATQSRHSPTQSKGKNMRNAVSSIPPYEIYTNARRMQSVGLTTLALGQAGFWASATNVSTQLADPLLGPTWTLFGFGLSAGFAFLITAYLRRSVSQLEVLNGPSIRIITRNLCGTETAPFEIAAKDILPGRHAEGSKERHWSFGVKLPSGRKYFYIVDMTAGVVDREGIAAIAKGGEHFMAWSLKRDALVMKERWQHWRNNVPPKQT